MSVKGEMFGAMMVRPWQLTGLSVLLAFAGMALPAGAAESFTPSPPAVVNWTGFYLGGDVGAVFNDAHFVRPASGLQEISIGTIDGRPTFGMFGGFNYQLSPWWVVGLEGNLNWLSGAYFNDPGGISFLQEARFVDSLAVRGGVLLRPDTMIYGKVGPAWVGVSGIQGFGTPFQQTLLGVQGAVGIEAMVTPNISVRGELSYTYADQLSLLPGTAAVYRPEFLMMQLGVSYKFDAPAGWGVPAPQRASLPGVPYLPNLTSFIPSPAPPAPILTKAERGMAVPDPAPRWTGIEFGGFVSANANQVRYVGNQPGDVMGQFVDFTVGGGWFVGANYQIERWVLGIEGSGNYENANFNTAGGGVAPAFFHFGNIDRVLAITGRVGWLMTPGTLLYAKGGPATMRFTPDTNYWNPAVNSVGGTGFSGYEAGIGIETYLLQNLSLRFEALYVHSGQTLVLNGIVPNEFTLQPSILSATLGLALHL